MRRYSFIRVSFFTLIYLYTLNKGYEFCCNKYHISIKFIMQTNQRILSTLIGGIKLTRKVAITIIIFIITITLIGCSKENNQDNEVSKVEDNTQNDYQYEVGKIHNWEGEIKKIKKHENMKDYSMVSWNGFSGGGNFTIKDSLVYEKYNLEVGQYISIVAKNIKDGLEIISIQKIEKRSLVKGIVENIDIENSIIYLKSTDKETFNEVITININNDTEFKNTLNSAIRKGDIIRVKGVLEDNIIISDYIDLISSLNTY